jgi:hypothetical protein
VVKPLGSRGKALGTRGKTMGTRSKTVGSRGKPSGSRGKPLVREVKLWVPDLRHAILADDETKEMTA